MKIVVTGANGNLGSRFVEVLHREGHEIIAIVRNASGNIPQGQKKVKILKWDLSSEDPSEELISFAAEADALIHCATYKAKDNTSKEEFKNTFETNVYCVPKLFSFCKQIKCNHLICFSGANSYLPSFGEKATESTPIYPQGHASLYLASVMTSENLFMNLGKQLGIEVTAFRCSSIFGPSPAGGGLISKFIKDIKKGKEIALHHNGQFKSNFVYIDDLIIASKKAILDKVFGIYNLANNQSYTLVEVADCIVGLIDNGKEHIKLLKSAPGTSATEFPEISISKFIKKFKVEPTPLKEAINLMIEYYD